MWRRSFPALIVAGCLALLPSHAVAQWTPGGTVIASGAQPTWHSATSDGMSGVLVHTAFSPQYLARRTPDGFSPAGWPTTAVPFHPVSRVTSDGAGGAFVWFRNAGPDNFQLVHHIGADGALAPDWPAAGRVIPDATAYDCKLVGDLAGGVYVVWASTNVDGRRLRALRLEADGDASAGWPAAGLLLDTTPEQWITLGSVHADGSGLFVQDWHGPQFLLREESFVAKVTPAGAIAGGWEPGARPFPFTTYVWDDQWTPDGAGGLFFSWADGNRGRLAHLLADGTLDPAWPDSGLALLPDSPSFQRLGTPVADGIGGCFAHFVFDSTGTWDMTSRVVRLTAGGAIAPGWPGLGARLPHIFDGTQFLHLVPDGVDGVYAAWLDDSEQSASPLQHGTLRAHHFGAFGITSLGWPESGVLLASGPGGRGSAQGFRSLDHGLILVWEDSRLYEDGRVDVMGIGLTAEGEITTDVPPGGHARGTALRVGPNPSANAVRLWLRMPRQDVARLEILDVNGRRVREVFAGTLAPGEHPFEWDGRSSSGGRAAPGLYLARSIVAGETRSTRFVRLASP